ncbi:MAG: hypothetical protein EBV19_10650, partial [Flavobacteriia bacterium]|nr:hypothetical protein [Flavobacteriia bacterium]
CRKNIHTFLKQSLERHLFKKYVTILTWVTILGGDIVSSIRYVYSRRRSKCSLLYTAMTNKIPVFHDPDRMEELDKILSMDGVTYPLTALLMTPQNHTFYDHKIHLDDLVLFQGRKDPRFHIVILTNNEISTQLSSSLSTQIIPPKSVSNTVPENITDPVIWIVDSCQFIHPATTLLYGLCYDLYHCDGIFWEGSTTEIIFRDNRMIDIEASPVSISLRCRLSYASMQSIINHVSENNMYLCSIGAPGWLPISRQRCPSRVSISSDIKPRLMLQTIDTWEVDVTEELRMNHHIALHYHSQSILMITWTRYTSTSLLCIKIVNKKTRKSFDVVLYKDPISQKTTRFVKVDEYLSPAPILPTPVSIIQTHEKNEMNLARFYSI